MLRLSLRVGFFLSLLSLSGVAFAQKPELNFSQVSPTVQVESYIATKNDGVVPHVRGSGTFISSTGLILTNNHVVERKAGEPYDIFTICLTSNFQEKPLCEYTASLVARYEEMDVALLQVHSKDIRGSDIPAFPSFPYKNNVQLTEGNEIKVVGFPGIGLDGITFTQGQVSGFQDINGFEYIKTDTIIAPGNSGGTALDADGNFVGIPTYGVSTVGSSLGYFLDIKQAVDWIEKHKNDGFQLDTNLYSQMVEYLQLRNDADYTKVYTHPYTPKFRLQIPEDWNFSEVERHAITVASNNEVKAYVLSIAIEDIPFEITDERYLEEVLFRKLERNKEKKYKSYERKKVEFQGVPAYFITHSFEDRKSVNYIVPYGGSIVFLNYNYDLKEESEATGVYTDLLKNFSFIESPNVPEPIFQVEDDTPPFSLKTVPGWYIQVNTDPQDENLILEIIRSEPEYTEGKIAISHLDLSKADENISNEEFLQNILQNHESTQNFQLLSKDANVVVDGLSGVSLTYTYPGEELSETKKISKIYLRDGKDYYFIRYDDLDKNYDKFLPDFQKILHSFQNLNTENQKGKGEYLIGSLDSVFADIEYHRYAEQIGKLKDEGIISGYRDNTFRPEKLVNRGETLKILLEAKVKADEKKDDVEIADELLKFTKNTYKNQDFSDTQDISWLKKYVRYARKKGIITGYMDDTFRPENTVTLAELLSMLYRLYEIPVWNPGTVGYAVHVPWQKPYMDKGYDFGIIPQELYNAPNHLLTRGELAAIVATFMEQEKQ